MARSVAEGKEKYNRELNQKGFFFEQEIDGVTYRVSNVKGGSDNIKIQALDKKQQVIGSALFWRHQYQDGLESLSTQVDPAWQGKGIAANMYAVMRMLGVNIHPATHQSDDGKKMWDKWRKNGDAKHIKSMNAKMTGVAEGEIVPLGKKHRGDLDSVNSCSKCGGKLEGGTYMGQRIKVCQPCKQVYLPPNSGIDQQGNKTKEQGMAEGEGGLGQVAGIGINGKQFNFSMI
jgi:hypothetical protein